MRLVSCPKCGVVVNLDKMINIDDCDCSKEGEFDRLKGKLNHCLLDHDYYDNGFFCPCCKKWVRIED